MVWLFIYRGYAVRYLLDLLTSERPSLLNYVRAPNGKNPYFHTYIFMYCYAGFESFFPKYALPATL